MTPWKPFGLIIATLSLTLAESRADDPIREAPRPIPVRSTNVGTYVPNLTLQNQTSKTINLYDLGRANGLVIAYTSTSCPITRKYGPSLAKLEEALAQQKIGLLLVNPTASDSIESMDAFVKNHDLSSPYVLDGERTLSKQLNASSTAEVFLIDAGHTIVYRGALDDQYGLGYNLPEPKNRYLESAIERMLDGRSPSPAALTAPGCELDNSQAKSIAGSTTYHNRISRIMQNNCVECHRDGGVGPFTLTSFDDVVSHAGMIRKVVERGTMPPWFAEHGDAARPSPWANDRSLSVQDETDLLAWLKSDRSVGDAKEAPLPRQFHDGWVIGKPDVVYQIPEPIAVKASGFMKYQNAVVETNINEDKWMIAAEVRPTAAQVVHHVLVFAVPPDANGKRKHFDETSGFFAAYVPGSNKIIYPEGYAKKLPKGSRLYFQIHYTPNGVATEDQTRVGLIFGDKPPQHEVRNFGIANTNIRIPANADNHPEKAQLRIPKDVQLLSFMPHMHVRGKAFRYEIEMPNKDNELILDVPHYDFNWQLPYSLVKPMNVAKGSLIKVTAWFDNSADNPANPDPSRIVPWGPQTYDEMMIGYIEYVVPTDAPEISTTPSKAERKAALFRNIDIDDDNFMSRKEYDRFTANVPGLSDPKNAERLFKYLDSDNDNKISVKEFEKLPL